MCTHYILYTMLLMSIIDLRNVGYKIIFNRYIRKIMTMQEDNRKINILEAYKLQVMHAWNNSQNYRYKYLTIESS